MENAKTFLSATGCSVTSSGNQLHITYHGLVGQSLETNGYSEFSLTFVASAIASVESWSAALPLMLGSFQGSCAQNSLYAPVGHGTLTLGCCFYIFQYCLFRFPSTVGIYSHQCFLLSVAKGI